MRKRLHSIGKVLFQQAQFSSVIKPTKNVCGCGTCFKSLGCERQSLISRASQPRFLASVSMRINLSLSKHQYRKPSNLYLSPPFCVSLCVSLSSFVLSLHFLSFFLCVLSVCLSFSQTYAHIHTHKRKPPYQCGEMRKRHTVMERQ